MRYSVFHTVSALKAMCFNACFLSHCRIASIGLSMSISSFLNYHGFALFYHWLQILHCINYCVRRHQYWLHEKPMLEGNDVRDSIQPCFSAEDVVALIMLGRITRVPSIEWLCAPCFLIIHAFRNWNSATQWAYGILLWSILPCMNS